MRTPITLVPGQLPYIQLLSTQHVANPMQFGLYHVTRFMLNSGSYSRESKE